MALGSFEDMKEDHLLVTFPAVRTIPVARETWIKRDNSGKVIGKFTQYPVVPAYAMTCHKSQGQTLPWAVVHCSQDVFSGLTYVAASRVKSDNHLQLKNFNLNFLLAPPTEVLSQTASYLGKVHPSKSCCPHKQLKEELFEASDLYTVGAQWRCRRGLPDTKCQWHGSKPFQKKKVYTPQKILSMSMALLTKMRASLPHHQNLSMYISCYPHLLWSLQQTMSSRKMRPYINCTPL